MISAELTPSLSPQENGQFQWQFACAMIQCWQGIAHLHEHDPERALIFLALWSLTLDPISNAPAAPDLGSSSNLSEVAFRAERGARLNQIARTACMNRKTVRRKLEAMIGKGLIVCSDEQRYLIAPRLVETNPDVAVALASHWGSVKFLLDGLADRRTMTFTPK